jgi:hypothetical protein
MTVQQALYTTLTTSTGLTALISTRVYAANRPELCAYPAIEYSVIDEDHEECLSQIAGWCNYSFQIDIYSRTYTEARNIAEQIRLVTQAESGTLGSTGSPPTGGISVGIFGWKARDLGNEILGDGSIVYRVMCEFVIGTSETQPNT